jgi:protein translocase SecG subunit
MRLHPAFFYSNYSIYNQSALWYYPQAMMFIYSTVLPFLPYVQIVLGLLLIAGILLQQRGSSLGGAFGGDNFSATFSKRRGGELFVFRATIVLGILFALSVLITAIF